MSADKFSNFMIFFLHFGSDLLERCLLGLKYVIFKGVGLCLHAIKTKSVVINNVSLHKAL